MGLYRMTNKNSLTKRFADKPSETNEQKRAEAVKLAAAIAAVAVCMLLIVVAWNMGKKHVALEDFVTVEYTGANGYATANCVIDEDKIVNSLIGKETDDSKKYLYTQFAKSLKAAAQNNADTDGISNGDRLTVTVTYDRELADSAGISVGSSTFNVRAKGIDAGTKIDLFEHLNVIFAGISPDAYVVTRNAWDDGYLSGLTFTADKTENIVVNDEITIHCDVDEAELGRHGYLTDSLERTYKVDRLSTYVEKVSQIDTSALDKNVRHCMNSIQEQTEDTTFRMLYKATQDRQYLYMPNTETAENITLIDMKFLKRNSGTSADLARNKIVLVFSADITCDGNTENVYFAYIYENAYVTADGEFNVLESSDGGAYYCDTNYDELMLLVLGGSEDNYTVLGLS
jgi:hypothetical protein